MKVNFLFATFILSGLAQIFVSAAQLPDAPMKYNWYKTSIVIFLRPEINEENTAEQLFVDAHRKYPGNAQAFPFNADKSAYYNPLSLRTSLALEWPTLSRLDPIVNNILPELRDETELGTLLDPVDIPINMPIKANDPRPTQDVAAELPAPTTPGSQFSEETRPVESQSGMPQLHQPQPELPQSHLETAQAAFIEYELKLESQSLLPLPENEHLMQTELTRLKSRDRYRVLYTATWIQAIPDRDKPVPILIQAGERKQGLFELEGTIAITLGRYLHANANLWFHSFPDKIEGAENIPEIRWMQLSESRRMRSTELHYLDHPKIGVLVQVDPVKIPERLNDLWREAQLENNN